jgi:hypothetical protein
MIPYYPNPYPLSLIPYHPGEAPLRRTSLDAMTNPQSSASVACPFRVYFNDVTVRPKDSPPRTLSKKAKSTWAGVIPRFHGVRASSWRFEFYRLSRLLRPFILSGTLD